MATGLRRRWRVRIEVAVLCILALAVAAHVWGIPEFGSYRLRPRSATIGTTLIAHALGGIHGQTLTNSAEAFRHNYDRGYRWFEVDLLRSSDGVVVCMHDGFETQYGLPSPFTAEQFRRSHPFGDPSLTPLTAADLLDLMREKTDWFLVTDVKDDNAHVLAELCRLGKEWGVDVTERIIPQLYSASDANLIGQLAFRRWILTMYRMEPDPNTAARILDQHPEIAAVTLPAPAMSGLAGVSGAEEIRRWIRLGKSSGARVFVHTVNDPKEAKAFLDIGVGLYTDEYPPTGEPPTRPAPAR